MKLKILRGTPLLFFSLCCAAFFFFAQTSSIASAHTLAATTGMVRFVHAAVGVQPAAAAMAQGTTTTGMTPAMAAGTTGSPGPVDVFVDGQGVATQLAYGATTNYLSIAAGAHMIQFAPAGKGVNAALVGQQVTVTAGGSQTVAVIGGTANAPLAIKVFADTTTMAATANNVTPAQLRVYHLATTIGTINMNVNNTAVVIGLLQGMASRYHSLTPGSATLQVVAQPTNQAQPVMAVNQAGQVQPVTLNLQGGMIYSVFLVDTPTTVMTTGTTMTATPTPATATNTMTTTGMNMQPVLAGTATSTATPGMPQTGSDPRPATMQPWEIAALLLLLSSGTGVLFLARRS